MDKKKPVKKRGGQRPGAGRKKTEEPTEPVTIYVKKISIQHHGGKNALKSILTKVAESHIVLETPSSPEKTKPPFPEMQQASKVTAIEYSKQVDRVWVLSRIKELEGELKSPPKNPMIGIAMWKRVREQEIENLKKQLQ